jgi:hypothetical protein
VRTRQSVLDFAAGAMPPVEYECAMLQSMLLDAQTTASGRAAEPPGVRLYTIRAADSEGHRSAARILVNRMYAWRGYVGASTAPAIRQAEQVTLVASEHGETVATLTVGFDGAAGLFVDDLFDDRTATLRATHAHLCEFTKLAVDGLVRSKRVLASMFHMAFLHALEVGHCDLILIEVNPRHVRYYQRMLGFEPQSEQRMNRRVGAPAVLLSLEMHHASAQIARFGGRPELASSERSLYPYFFSPVEVAGILRRVN